jgi:2,4-dienoyl-CoA reductase-like NADH-dependent reductase (Old Yellow Enzyme family)
MPGLFDPLALRGLTLSNRIVVSPMCQYSSDDGFATEWHLVHLGSRAVGGAGLVFTEAAAVLPEGRISPEDLGFWKDEQVDQLARIGRFVKEQGSAFGIQLAHAGRKASTYRPWDQRRGMVPEDQGGWRTVGPSPVRFGDGYPNPVELEAAGIKAVIAAYGAAAERAVAAGFDVIEIHAAHGYLLHQFLSPVSNHRRDEYGGEFENRVRLLLAVVDETRAIWPERLPLFVRISATDWWSGGWTIEQSVELARLLAGRGVDLVDCSSGGNVAGATIPVGPGYQTGFAERIRRDGGVATGAVGLITDPAQADHIVRTGQADLVILAREMLRHPYWPLHAARSLGVPMTWPAQYLRAAPAGSPPRGPGRSIDS